MDKRFTNTGFSHKQQVEKLLHSPADHFDSPNDVLERDDLSPSEKCEILKQWESDGRLLAVAEEENMQGGERNRVREIALALQKLEQQNPSVMEENKHTPGPTKSG